MEKDTFLLKGRILLRNFKKIFFNTFFYFFKEKFILNKQSGNGKIIRFFFYFFYFKKVFEKCHDLKKIYLKRRMLFKLKRFIKKFHGFLF